MVLSFSLSKYFILILIKRIVFELSVLIIFIISTIKNKIELIVRLIKIIIEEFPFWDKWEDN
jgi:hypothetical protein